VTVLSSIDEFASIQCLVILVLGGEELQDTEILAQTLGYVDQHVKELTEIWLHPNNFDRQKGFRFSQLPSSIYSC
jgi:hypothetical protein